MLATPNGRPRTRLVAAAAGDEDDGQGRQLGNLLQERQPVAAGRQQLEKHQFRALGADQAGEVVGVPVTCGA